MNRIFYPLFLLSLAAAVSCSGRVSDERSAVEALRSGSVARRREALARLASEPHERRVELGLKLFFSPDPFLGAAGVALLASAGPPPEAWEKIRASLGDERTARRFAALCARVPDPSRLGLLLSLMRRLPAEDTPVFLKALEAAAGVSLGGPGVGKAELCRRWEVWLAFRDRGMDGEFLSALASLWTAEDDYRLAAAVRRLGPDGVVEAAEEILRLSRDKPVVGREAALALDAGRAGDACLPLLLSLLESDDYLTRYNALHALERMTGMKLNFDPAASPEERASELERLEKMLGLRR